MSVATPARPAPPTTTADPRLPVVLIVLLGLLTAVAPLAIDMYLPAFPQIASDLGTSASGVQLTMTALLVGLAVGQLVIGPLSDGVGRRRPLLAGTVLCFLASVVCALAPTVEVLTAARFLQGVGGAAGIVLARAIVTDTSRGAAATRILGVLMIIGAVAPIVGPLLGGAIITGFGWRAVFWFVAGLVALMFVGALVWAQETRPEADRTSGGLSATVAAARVVLARRAYTGNMLTFCLAFCAMFAYISASPFVLQNILGFSAGTYSIIFALNAAVIMITSGVAAACANRWSARGMVRVGLLGILVSAVGLLVCALSGVPLAATLAFFALLQAALGFVFGNATGLALEAAGHHAGTGSAFLGATQFVLAAVLAPLVGLNGEDSALPMAVIMCVAAVLALGAFRYAATGNGAHPHSAQDLAASDTAA